MNITKELLEKAKTAKTAEELLELAKAENIELTEEQAKEYYATIHASGELPTRNLTTCRAVAEDIMSRAARHRKCTLAIDWRWFIRL